MIHRRVRRRLLLVGVAAFDVNPEWLRTPADHHLQFPHAMKTFAVRIQEGARPHLSIVRAEGPDAACLEAIEQLKGDAERLLGAKIAVWEHGSLHRSSTPLFIKSVRPFEATPDIHVIQAIREELRRARWRETKARAEELKHRESHQFEEPYERWLEAHQPEPGRGFFELPTEVRRECLELRDRLKHVPPGQMTRVQARFIAVFSGFDDLHRFELHAVQERLAETLEMVHHHLAGLADRNERRDEELPPLERLAHLIGIPTGDHPSKHDTNPVGQAG